MGRGGCADEHLSTAGPLPGEKPAGLADLLRATREHIPVVVANSPEQPLPQSVHRLAGERGASKADVEARALVDDLAPWTGRP